ncbi:hypothetical protein GQ44DRAFT_821706 [Phaeosphaeriaceae sp. PMI808]|nr:hypothetical protein GQ44DRAFT_821706 [Phaeosphaeriaceae sp. PMI808]
MGTSPLLVDTYRRYKRDTKAFTQWLCATARATGLTDSLFNKDTFESQQPNKTRRRKSKHQRSQMKFNAYEIPIGDFRILANAIKDTGDYKVPRYMMAVLRDIIRARKRCAAWYQAHQVDESEIKNAHNDGHQYIIKALEEVFEIFSPIQEKAPTESPPIATETSNLTNIFGSLKVEDCPTWDMEDVRLPAPSKKAQQDSYQPEASPEDVSLALYCFMKDMTDIRIFIRRTWREYKYGHITLDSAAVMSNTAIDVMHHLNDSFIEAFPQFAEHVSLLGYLYGDYIDPTSKESNIAHVEHPEGFGSYQNDDIHLSSETFFCVHTTYELMEFYSKESLPAYQRNPTGNQCVLTFLQCLIHIHLLIKFVDDKKSRNNDSSIFETDQILQAARIMERGEKFPTWAVFACQVFIDTIWELDTKVVQGFQDLKKEAGWLLEFCSNYLKYGNENGVRKFQEQDDNIVRKQVKALRALLEKDVVKEIINCYIDEQHEVNAVISWGDCFLLKSHPILCGLIVHSQLVQCHLLGTRIAANLGLVTAVVHLSNAVALTGNIPNGRIWADLDYIIEKHGDAYLFVGERPTEPVECFRHLCLAFGCSAAFFSMNKKNYVDGRHSKNPSQASYQAYSRKRRLRPISRYAQASLAHHGFILEQTRASKDPVVMMKRLIDSLVNAKDVSRPADPYNEKTDQKACHMKPLQSLAIFKAALKMDDFPLRFDMASFNWRCLRLLRRIQKICVEESPCQYPKEEYGGDLNLRCCVVRMFRSLGVMNDFQPNRFNETCALLIEVMTMKGNKDYLKAEARTGIKSGTAVDPKDDPEIFEDPIQYLKEYLV